MGLVLLFAAWVTIRFSINLGTNKEKKAINTMRTGMLTSIVMIPILMLVSKTWMSSMFTDSHNAKIVSEQAYRYDWRMIIWSPFMVFNQIIVGLFRAKTRNKEILLAMPIPIFINLGLDILLMGSVGMDIQRGTITTTILWYTSFELCILQLRTSSSLSIINNDILFIEKNVKQSYDTRGQNMMWQDIIKNPLKTKSIYKKHNGAFKVANQK
ncbi:MATE family efflux transporter [Candidatus Mycoplasma mahonii]|uniref:MATE family efflux transporter n=1 Tax=Candidatus Mycoplasma mahonii TaxID=3004105 RepID=UPI0026EED282|nr:MATE family efflux transporter [Candidatus Mycoplasma mahonii]WKX02646.1 MATE family efflux transporter [Candidatus Mycoplasma mahonii]